MSTIDEQCSVVGKIGNTLDTDRQWKYTDEERNVELYGDCYDCGLPYSEFDVELVVAHDIWELINPTYHRGAGTLCHSCMIERLLIKKVGIVDILFFGINYEKEDTNNDVE